MQCYNQVHVHSIPFVAVHTSGPLQYFSRFLSIPYVSCREVKKSHTTVFYPTVSAVKGIKSVPSVCVCVCVCVSVSVRVLS